jgi:hypothetical protein
MKIFKLSLPSSFSFELAIPEPGDKPSDKPSLKVWSHGVYHGIGGDLTLSGLAEINRHLSSCENWWVTNEALTSELENRVDCAIKTDSNGSPATKKSGRKKGFKFNQRGKV